MVATDWNDVSYSDSDSGSSEPEKPEDLVTSESFAEMLESAGGDRLGQIIGSALLAILDHKRLQFNQADAEEAKISALAYRKNGNLQDWVVKKWMVIENQHLMLPKIHKYWSYLNIIAMEKANERAKNTL